MKGLLHIAFIGIVYGSIAQSSANFRDISEQAGIKSFGSNYGVSFGDFDNDGDDDLYVTTRQSEANLFYKNNSDGYFTEAAEEYGLSYTGSSTASLWIDIDNDGFLDLFLSNDDAENMLFKNQEGKSFADISAKAGIYHTTSPLSLNAADVNNDGFIDIYLSNPHIQNTLYLNNGDETFSDQTLASGATDQQIAMGSIFFDYDNDGDQDLYLTHDAKQANILYQNDGTGRFTDVSSSVNADYRGYGMGVDIADFNNDGFQDIYITNLEENVLYLNRDGISFINIGRQAGVDDEGMGWGVLCFDFDHDGRQDIYAVNNSFFSPHPNLLYKNLGDNTFSIVSKNTELESRFAGFGAACSDIDNDGDLDIFLANSGKKGGNQLFLNESAAGNWLKLKTVGRISNRMGVGAQVQVATGDKTLSDQVIAGSGYASQNSATLHFGLDQTTLIDQLSIKWPSGIEDVYENIEANQFLKAVEGEGLEPLRVNVVTATETQHLEAPLVKIFPNPSFRVFTIKIGNPKRQRIDIHLIDISGRRVREIADRIFNPGIQNIRVEHTFPQGLYVLQLKGASIRHNQRIVIKE